MATGKAASPPPPPGDEEEEVSGSEKMEGDRPPQACDGPEALLQRWPASPA